MRKVDLDVVYVYVVNMNLNMSRGKIAAQVSHVAMLLADLNKPIGRAIVLRAEEGILEDLIKMKEVVHIRDAGLTEVPKDSLTCIGFIRTPKMKLISREFKLL